VPDYTILEIPVLGKILLRFRGPLVLLVHLGLIPLGYWLAYCLRFDYPLPEAYAQQFAATVLLLIPIRLLSFRLFGLYQGWWRHVGMQDLVDLVRAVTLSSALFVAALYLTQTGSGLPRLVLVLDWLLAIFLFGGLRFAVRGYREKRASLRGGDRRATGALCRSGRGRARSGSSVQVHQGGNGFRPVGLVDDDPAQAGDAPPPRPGARHDRADPGAREAATASSCSSSRSPPRRARR
jgi:FlaA1/EpsC-like NDP-sugar epimerase